MKYEIGQKVKIKSLDWYNEDKDEYGYVRCIDFLFTPEHSKYCGCEFTISHITDFQIPSYIMENNGHEWTDEMIEGLVEEEKVSNANSITQDRVDKLACKNDEELPSGNPYEWECPDGYVFKDENGNIINATKIVLEKKRKEYPKTYEECCEIMNVIMETEIVADAYLERLDDYELNLDTKIENFRKLLICRDAYWKIAGEEMGLGKPWAPDWANQKLSKYCIASVEGRVINAERYIVNTILTFPTIETRDAFYEYFKSEIESCKELL